VKEDRLRLCRARMSAMDGMACKLGNLLFKLTRDRRRAFFRP